MAKRIDLAPKLDTASTQTLRDHLLAAADQDIVLVGTQVELFGALALELIMSAANIWKRQGLAISLEDPSTQMIDDLHRFGLTPDTLLESAV